MTRTDEKVAQVADAALLHGHKDIIVLSGVPGTGKTHISSLAALRVAGHAAFLRRTQFHPAYSYEDFIEGLRPRESGGYEAREGVFLEWNRQASRDVDNRYVLLIEELSRADLPAVLGEVLTFIEHRGVPFQLPVSQIPASVAPGLIVMATMNFRDRSAMEIDEALLRRMRIIDCPPDLDQLEEMLTASLSLAAAERSELIERVKNVFISCEEAFPDLYRVEMPFGHGMFADISSEEDLAALWDQRIRFMLYRPQGLTHPFAEVIADAYEWREGSSRGSISRQRHAALKEGSRTGAQVQDGRGQVRFPSTVDSAATGTPAATEDTAAVTLEPTSRDGTRDDAPGS